MCLCVPIVSYIYSVCRVLQRGGMLGDIARFRDITRKGVIEPPPWSEIQDPEHAVKPPWVPRKITSSTG